MLCNKFPRGVQGLAKPETNVVIGPFMQSVSKALAKSFMDGVEDEWPRFGYTSGATPEHIGKWYKSMKERHFNFIEDDFSSYDATQGKGCHEAELDFFKKFNPPDMAWKALKFQASTKGYGHFHEYSVEYTRKSGDQNTSIGNTYINFLAHAYAIHLYDREYHVTTDYYMIGLGDDNLLAVDVPLRQLSVFMKYCETVILNMGLKPKMKISNNAPTYCSCEFVPLEDGNQREQWLMVPQVLRMICKMGFTHSSIGSSSEASRMRLKGNMLGMKSLSVMPVLRSYYKYYTSCQGKADEESKYNCHRKMKANDYNISDNTEKWFQDTYGLSYIEIGVLESYIYEMLQQTNGTASLWNHRFIKTMIDHRRAVVG